jgi:hypothetical protein
VRKEVTETQFSLRAAMDNAIQTPVVQASFSIFVLLILISIWYCCCHKQNRQAVLLQGLRPSSSPPPPYRRDSNRATVDSTAASQLLAQAIEALRRQQSRASIRYVPRQTGSVYRLGEGPVITEV